jgi:branched-subunit amino acid aminotransferase/4-amino-4-deoxychorismate lyase
MNKIQIIDTFKISNAGIHLKGYHIQRTIEAFVELGVSVEENAIFQIYEYIEKNNLHLSKDMKAKIIFNSETLSQSVVEISQIESLPNPITVELSNDVYQLSGRGLQNYKISKRDYWNQALKNTHCFDVIGINQEDQVTETSRFNLFLLQDNIFYTPTLDSGCINGCYRRFLLDQGYISIFGQKISIQEKNILATDIDQYEIFVGNSLRGMHKVILFKT